MRAAAVVFEPGDELGRAGADVGLDRDVADQPRAGIAHGLEIDEPEPGDALSADLIAVPKQLIAATDGEHDRVGVDGRRDRSRLVSSMSPATSSWSRSWPPPM